MEAEAHCWRLGPLLKRAIPFHSGGRGGRNTLVEASAKRRCECVGTNNFWPTTKTSHCGAPDLLTSLLGYLKSVEGVGNDEGYRWAGESAKEGEEGLGRDRRQLGRQQGPRRGRRLGTRKMQSGSGKMNSQSEKMHSLDDEGGGEGQRGWKGEWE